MKRVFVIICFLVLVLSSACSKRDADLTYNPQNTPNEADITEPISDNISNNGGTVVQYGDTVYFLAMTDKGSNSNSQQAIFAMGVEGAEMQKIVEVNYGNFYIIDNYIIARANNNIEYQIAKMLCWRV